MKRMRRATRRHRRRAWRWLAPLLTVLTFSVVGCGAQSDDPTVARVGDMAIHKSAVAQSLMSMERETGDPEVSGAHERERALDKLIYAYWVIGEARMQHLLSVGNIPPGPDLEVEARRAATALRRSLIRQSIRLTSAEVSSYYKSHLAHLAQFYVPEQRLTDMIGVLPTRIEAEQLKRHLGTGAEFRSRAERKLIRRPPRFGKGLTNNNSLLETIFKAKIGEIPPPVELDGGWDLVIVRRIVPAHSVSLQEARPTVVKLLTEERRVEAIKGFVDLVRQRWSAQTSCSAGFVVPGCKQHVGSAEVADEEDPFYLPS